MFTSLHSISFCGIVEVYVAPEVKFYMTYFLFLLMVLFLMSVLCKI